MPSPSPGKQREHRCAECCNREVIKPPAEPIDAQGGTVVLQGNLAPGGAVIKQSAASPHLMEHKGRAVVFESMDDLKERVDDPKLDVDETSVLVLKCAGPKGAPGMPECGDLPIPVKLLQVGVMDMVRISDARMTGTSYGSIALHVAPESAVGSPLAIVRSGDMIELDVAERRLELLIPEAEMKKRLAAYRVPPRHYRRGYGKVYLDHVLQANHGCDFDFLRSC